MPSLFSQVPAFSVRQQSKVAQPNYGQSRVAQPNYGQSRVAGPPAPKPSVLGASTSVMQGPGMGTYGAADRYQAPAASPVSSGISSGAGLSMNPSSGVYEQNSDGPDLNSVNSSFAPALAALNEYQGSLQNQLGGSSPLMGESDLRSEAANTKGILQAGLAEKKQAYAGQRQREEGRTQSVVAEARRQGNELIQGLQSKFGGSTGTGAFVGELTSRQVLQNVAQNRASLQNTLMQINDAEMSMEREVQRQTEGLDMKLQSDIQGLRENLMQQIQQINMQRGQLESQKAQSKIDLLNQFRQQKAEVEARNAAFRQQLFMEAQKNKSQAQQLRDSAISNFEAVLKQFGGQGLYPQEASYSSKTGESNVRFAPNGQDQNLMTIPGGSTLFDPSSGKPVFTAPRIGEEMQNPFK